MFEFKGRIWLFSLEHDKLSNTEAKAAAATTQLLDDASAYFGLGFQVHEIKANNFLFFEGETVRSLGHAGLGGSIVFTIPERRLTVAFTTNQLDQQGLARNQLLNIIFEEFGLQPPNSMQR